MGAFENWDKMSHDNKIRNLRMLIVDDFGTGFLSSILGLLPKMVSKVN